MSNTFSLKKKDDDVLDRLLAMATVIRKALQLTSRNRIRIPIVDRPAQNELLLYLQDEKVIGGYEVADFPDNKNGEYYASINREPFGDFEGELRKEIQKRKTDREKNKRRVFFDENNGHLYLDGKRIYTASLDGAEIHFLSFLWQNWERQMPHTEITKYVRGRMGSEVSDTYQNFSAKMKSNIKSECKEINTIITIPTPRYFMMADPADPA